MVTWLSLVTSALFTDDGEEDDWSFQMKVSSFVPPLGFCTSRMSLSSSTAFTLPLAIPHCLSHSFFQGKIVQSQLAADASSEHTRTNENKAMMRIEVYSISNP